MIWARGRLPCSAHTSVNGGPDLHTARGGGGHFFRACVPFHHNGLTSKPKKCDFTISMAWNGEVQKASFCIATF